MHTRSGCDHDARITLRSGDTSKESVFLVSIQSVKPKMTKDLVVERLPEVTHTVHGTLKYSDSL